MIDSSEDEVFVPPAGVELRRSLRRLTTMTLVLYLGLLAVVAFGWVTAQRQSLELRTTATTLEATATSVNNALCALRGDLEDRAEATEDFLKDHPEGFAGVPAQLIRDQLDNTRRTILALAALDCSSGI